MLGPTNETVGQLFQVDLLRTARDSSLKVLEQLAQWIKPGTSELEAKEKLKEIQLALGSPKHWHPPQIRFGENTLLPFGKVGIENNRLKENDIFFLDIGPLFDDHEGDVGRTFTVGSDLEMKRCAVDVEEIWHEVRHHWFQQKPTGGKLYEFAKACAERRGWILTLEKANGHRISDFPHAIKIRGSIEGFEAVPASDRWILEVQIRHPSRPFGAFYEDLLN